METGQGREHFTRCHISGETIRQQLIAAGWQLQSRAKDAGPAQVFAHPDYLGEIRLIMPYERDFCLNCNRLRVSAMGRLHLCLFGEQGIDLRDLLQYDTRQPELTSRITASVQRKPQTHFLHQGNIGGTQNFSFIGG